MSALSWPEAAVLMVLIFCVCFSILMVVGMAMGRKK